MLYLGHDFIRLSNAFVLPDPNPPQLLILDMDGQELVAIAN